MSLYPNLNALEKAIRVAAQKAIASEAVLGEIKRVIREKEQEMVYGSYTPYPYQRRHSLGNQFQVQQTGLYSVRVWDIAPPNYSVFNTPYQGPAGSFAQWINDGSVPNVFNTKSYPWAGPRPFYRAAEAELQNSAVLKRAVINGIKSQI